MLQPRKEEKRRINFEMNKIVHSDSDLRAQVVVDLCVPLADPSFIDKINKTDFLRS